MKRVVFERNCLFAEDNSSIEDRKLRNQGRVIVSEKKDRMNVYVGNRDLKPGVIEVLDLLSVSGFSLSVVSEIGVKETKTKIDSAMIGQYIDKCFSVRTAELSLRDYLSDMNPDDFIIIVCRSEELIATAVKLHLPTIRVLGGEIIDKGSATLSADNIDQADDVVFQAVVFDEIAKKISTMKRCRMI